MQKWEYLVLRAGLFDCLVTSAGAQSFGMFSRPALADYLNKLGSEGWEVAGMSRDSNTEHGIIILKRPLAASSSD